MKIKPLYAALMMTLVFSMTGCGGGGGGGGAVSTVSGIAAAGAVLSGTVSLKDASNPPQVKPINPDGSYLFDVTGRTGPFILKAVGSANGNNYTLFSLANGAGRANINPMSTIVVKVAAGNDPAGIYDAPTAAELQGIASNLGTALQQIQTTLRPLLLVYNSTTVNPISDEFVANGKGLDGMLDAIRLVNTNNSTVTITNSTDGVIFTGQANAIQSGTVTRGNVTIPPTYTKAIIKLSSANVPTGVLIAGIQSDMILPPGVTPAVLNGIDASGSVTMSGVTVNGAFNFSGATFAADTGVLTFLRLSTDVSNPNSGMPAGEFLTITCNVAQGANLANFPIQAINVNATDQNANSITGVTVPVSVTFQ